MLDLLVVGMLLGLLDSVGLGEGCVVLDLSSCTGCWRCSHKATNSELQFVSFLEKKVRTLS